MEEKNNPHYLLVFVAIIAAYIVSSGLLALLFLINNINAINYAPLLEILIFLLPLFFLKDKNNITFYGLKNKFKISLIPCILWAFVGILLLESGLMSIMGEILPNEWYYAQLQQYAEITATMMQDNNFIFNTFVFAIVPAVCEEALFRGYLLQNILKKHSPIVAITLSALAFSIIHFEPIAFLELFIIGIFLGVIYLKTNSLLPSIILHFINNFIVILSYNFSQQEYSINELDANIWFSIICLIVGAIIMYISYRKMKSISTKIN